MCCRQVRPCPNYATAAPESTPPGSPSSWLASTGANGNLVSGPTRQQKLGEAEQRLQPDPVQYRAHRVAAPLHQSVRGPGLHRNRGLTERVPAQTGRRHHLRPTGPGDLTRRRVDNRGRRGSQAQPEPRNPGDALHGLATPGRPPLPRSQTIRTGVPRRRQRHRHSGYQDRPPVQGNYRRTHHQAYIQNTGQEGPQRRRMPLLLHQQPVLPRKERRIKESEMQPFYLYSRLIAVLEQGARAQGQSHGWSSTTPGASCPG